MNHFTQTLESIEYYKKQKDYDRAWRIANSYILHSKIVDDDMWYMMYYQMADISARRKNWFGALEKMGYMIHYADFPKGVGGISHEKFVLRLLKKFNITNKYESYLELCKQTNPQKLQDELKKLVK